jgi:hypothetical protein
MFVATKKFNTTRLVHTKSRSFASASPMLARLSCVVKWTNWNLEKVGCTGRVRVSLVTRSGPQFHCVVALLFLDLAVPSHFVAFATLSICGVILLELARQAGGIQLNLRVQFVIEERGGLTVAFLAWVFRGSIQSGQPWTRNSRATRRGTAVFSPSIHLSIDVHSTS